MPLQNLNFTIVHATGWDENYPPQQLLPKDKNAINNNKNNNNTNNEMGIKHGKGWQSEKNCSYPQEIILQVTCGPARIRKLQILSHHYKIASKLEIYVGSIQRRKEVAGGMTNNINNNNNNNSTDADTKRIISWDKMPKIIENDGISSGDDDDCENEGVVINHEDAVFTTSDNKNNTNYDSITMNGEPYIHFKRLGYCALDSNERANYKAREFKSVRLDVEGEYIRLVARKCHPNHLNQHNQVGIVGLTVLGEPADYLLAGESEIIPIENIDDALSRVESPETCLMPITQENCYNPYDQKNIASLYSLLVNCNNGESLNPSTSSLVINNINNTITSLLNDATPPSSSSSSSRSSSIGTLLSTASSSSTTVANESQQQIIATKRKLKDYLTSNDFLQNQNDTTRLLTTFDKAKKNAVQIEDFRLAKLLKYSVELMKRVVEEIARIDILKREAVEKEDFDNADQYKQDIEALKNDVRSEFSDEGLEIDDQDEVVVYDPQLDPQLQDIIGLAVEDDNNNNDNNNNNNNNNNSVDPTSQDGHYCSVWMSKQQSNLQQQLQITDYVEEDPEDLSDLARSAFALSIQYFGSFLISSLLSKKPQLCELALSEISKRIEYHISSDNHHNRSDGDDDDVLSDKLALIKASYQVIQEGLNNLHQENLLMLTLSLWQNTINYLIHHQIPISSTYKLVEQTYPSLFTKISESDQTTTTTTDAVTTESSIKNASVDLLILLIKTYQNSKYSLINSLILKPAKTPSQPSKQAKTKIDVVMRLIDEFGVSLLTKEKLKLHYKYQEHNHDQFDQSVVVKIGYEHLMELSLSYLNNNNADVRQIAVKLVFEIIKRVGKQLIEPYLVNNNNLKYQNLVNDIWNLVTEYEEVNGEIIQRVPTPDPIIIAVKPKDHHLDIKNNNEITGDNNNSSTTMLTASPTTDLYPEVLDLTEEEKKELEELERLENENENFEIDQSLLSKPLAKRGTVTRIEQQLMELRSMVNNTNNIINEDYDSYLANSTKQQTFQRDGDDDDDDECGPSVEKEETVKSQPTSNKQTSKKTTRNPTKPSSSSSSPPNSTNKTKKPLTNQPLKKAPSSAKNNKTASVTNTNKPPRRGSTDDSKAGPKGIKKPQSKNLDTESLCDETEDYSDRCCIFCDEQNNNFTEENLVIHYWNECPILTKCHLCNIILEISTLDEHMLKDCDKSKFVKQCQRCREIIEADDYLEHIAKQSCMTIRPDIVRCPLCKTVIKPATETGWKDHLLNTNGCPRNSRKIKSLDNLVNDVDGGVIPATDTTTTIKEISTSPSTATKKRSKVTTGDSPKSATTKSSGGPTTNRKTTSGGVTTTAGKTKKTTTSSSTTKVSKTKK